MADIDQISTVLGKLENNYSELAHNFYTLFYDSNPQDITLEWYDENGILQTLTIPNRAKDLQYIQTGNINPEGFVEAQPSTIFQNLKNGELFVKSSGTGKTGWVKLISESSLDSYIIKGNGDPNGNYTGKLGTLYIDNSSGILYVKITKTTAFGWETLIDVASACLVHYKDLNERIIIDIDLI